MVVAAAALGGLAVPGAAHAAPLCWEGIETTRAGELMVKGGYDSPDPATLLIHLRDKETGARVATVDKFRVEYLEDDYGFYAYSDPIKLDKLGLYAIEVETPDRIAQCGDFDYRLRSDFSGVTSTPVSLDNLTSTFSTDITTFDPRTGQTSPLRNTKVRVEGPHGIVESATDDAGHFSAPVTYRGTETETETKAFVVLPATAEMDAEQRSVTPSVVRQPASIELDANSLEFDVRYSEVLKITGRATRTAADGTVKPVPAGTRMRTGLNQPVTGADGRFERTVRAIKDGWINTTWVTAANYPWLEYASGLTRLDVDDATSFGDFKASIDAAKRVTVTGKLGRVPSTGHDSAKVEIQYSADGRTGWTTRKTIAAQFHSEFQGTLSGPADGYWRLRFAGDTDNRAGVSKPLRVTRTDTAFSAFNVNPEPVRRGKPVTVTGTLKHKSPTWKTYGGQTVYVYFRPAGSQTLTYMGRATTAADGTFKRVLTAESTGTWLARYRDSDGKHVNAESRLDDVTVNR